MLPRVTRRQSIIWWGLGGALLLFAGTGLFGALVKTGQQQGPWQVNVISATVSMADTPPLQRKDPANRWLVIKAKVEVTDMSSHTGLASILRLSGVDGLVAQEPGVVLVRDGTRIDRLHPGLPEELTFAWEQAAAAAAPQRLTLRVSGGAPIDVAVTAS
jgi:hypothetical protein